MTVPSPTAPVKLMMVTEANNNKVYNMIPNGDSITVEWGRVGAVLQTATYPISKWNSLYNSKVKKGYKDITVFVKVSSKKSGYKDIPDMAVRKLMDSLLAFARKSVSDNYTISSDAVTQAQVSEAQSILDEVVMLVNNQNNGPLINKRLLDLYAVIPRKMNKVQNYLVQTRIDSHDGLVEARRILDNEQKTLDVMRGQVNMQGFTPDDADQDQKTILEVLGISVVPGDVQDESIVKRLMAHDSSEFRKVFKVVHFDSRAKYEKHVLGAKNKKSDLFWHGSRNENWISILQSGLKIRPSNAVLTGAMFGHGIYFADKYRKSAGYTSLSGSYWARGNNNVAYLALMDVHVGNQLRISRHTHECLQLNRDRLRMKGDFDSVFAESGYDLRSPEYIIYDDAQSTIKYLVEVGR
jgi:poly [ADP-ribose] polymerase